MLEHIRHAGPTSDMLEHIRHAGATSDMLEHIRHAGATSETCWSTKAGHKRGKPACKRACHQDTHEGWGLLMSSNTACASMQEDSRSCDVHRLEGTKKPTATTASPRF